MGVHAIPGIHGPDSRLDCGALLGSGSFCILAGRSREERKGIKED